MTKRPEDRYELKGGIYFFDMTDVMSDEEYMAFGMGVVDFFQQSLCKGMSKTEIRRHIKQGACKINDVAITNEKARISLDRHSFNSMQCWMIIFRD